MTPSAARRQTASRSGRLWLAVREAIATLKWPSFHSAPWCTIQFLRLADFSFLSTAHAAAAAGGVSDRSESGPGQATGVSNGVPSGTELH